MKSKITLLCLSGVLTISFTGCGAYSAKSKEVVFDDEKKIAGNGDVVITNGDVAAQAPAVDKTQSSAEQNKILPDDSEIVTMRDGMGSVSETRYFKNHPLVKFILIRTSPNGTKQIFAYGYGKETKILPASYAEKALNASADEIASAAALKTKMPYDNKFVNFMQKPETAPTPVSPEAVQPLETVQPQAPPPNTNAPLLTEPLVAKPENSFGDEKKSPVRLARELRNSYN